jgi:hypothetical protein
MDVRNAQAVDLINADNVSNLEVIELLHSLAAFNKLDETILDCIDSSFNVDSRSLCKKRGITYWTNNKK